MICHDLFLTGFVVVFPWFNARHLVVAGTKGIYSPSFTLSHYPYYDDILDDESYSSYRCRQHLFFNHSCFSESSHSNIPMHRDWLIVADLLAVE